MYANDMTVNQSQSSFDQLLAQLGREFGVLAESDTYQLTVIAHNTDVAVGDLFLLPSRRGHRDRFYIFRTTQYANILNRSLEMADIARNRLTMPDSYFSQDFQEELLLELKGIVLGYAEVAEDGWAFFRPRRLPEHLTQVYQVTRDSAVVLRELLASQLGREGLFMGHLLAGEQALENVPVYLPAYALSHHIGVFGRTGAGKSNLMMVLLKSVLDYNRQTQQTKGSILAIDPHDEFRYWHRATGGADGIHGIVTGYSSAEQVELVKPFYYLSAREVGNEPLARQVFLSRADVLPDDLIGITDFSEQQVAFAQYQFARWGEQWISRSLMGDTQGAENDFEGNVEFLAGTIAAVQRRLTQINTELTMALGNEQERREAIRNASADLSGFERELQVMSKGQALVSASY